MAHDWAREFDRQAERGALADHYWRLAGGRPGFRVAEVGCGGGWFALRYAALTGPTGHVHVVDEDPDALAHLGARLDPAHHAHVTLERLDATRAPLPDLHFHALFLTDSLHHMELHAALRKLRGAGAPLVVAEYDPAAPCETGPPREMRIGRDDLQDALRETGWTPSAVVELPFEHYAIVARPV